jgi:hypothetical protein
MGHPEADTERKDGQTRTSPRIPKSARERTKIEEKIRHWAELVL